MTTTIDLHTHTRWGSQCSYMMPDELVERAKAVGLDGVCITEHNQLWSREAIAELSRKHRFLVIGGVEVSTDVGEILAFGLHESVSTVYEAADLRRMVAMAHGAMVAAHPFRGIVPPAPGGGDYDSALRVALNRPAFRVVDALEVHNGMAGVGERRFAAAVAARLGLGATGGSDAHATLAVGSAVTVFDGAIRSEEDLVAALRAGCYQAKEVRVVSAAGSLIS